MPGTHAAKVMDAIERKEDGDVETAVRHALENFAPIPHLIVYLDIGAEIHIVCTFDDFSVAWSDAESGEMLRYPQFGGGGEASILKDSVIAFADA